jgi:hypothetical protein
LIQEWWLQILPVRNNIQYKYTGLRVYQTDTLQSYVWTGLTWSIDGNGIYGGSGSLVGNTNVFLGNIGSSLNSNI